MPASVEAPAVPPSPLSEPEALPPAPVVVVRPPPSRFALLVAAIRRTPLAPFLEALALFAAIGASVGFCVWAIVWPEHVFAHVVDNTLAYGNRRGLVQSVGIGGAVALAVGWLLWVERKGGSIDRLRQVGLRLSPLIVTGLVPILLDWRLWNGRELEGLIVILCTCLGLEYAVRTSLETGPCVLSPGNRIRWRSLVSAAQASTAAQWLPVVLVLIAAASYAVFFSLFSTNNHYRIGTAAFDLGIENNLVWNAAHLNGPLFKTSPLGGPTTVHSGYHQTFISYLIAIPYRLWPTPEFLLVLQATVIGAAALPLYVWLKGRTGRWLAALISIAYLFYPPVHGGNLYDFHYQPFGPFFLFTAIVFFERGKWKSAALFTLLTLSLREDMSLMLVVAGAYLMVTRQRVFAGLLLAGVCATVFVVQKMIIMPMLLDGQAAYIHQYKGLIAPGDSGFGGVLKTVITNPAYTLISLLKLDKITYALHIFAPLVLLPLRNRIGWLLCLPGFFFTLLSTEYPPLVSITFQYTSYWSMFVFLACGWAMATAAPSRRYAMGAAMLLATVAATWNYGGWLRNDVVRGGFWVHHFKLTDEDHRKHKEIWTLIDQIPPDAPVAATEGLNPLVSSRMHAYALRHAVFDAEYVLMDRTLASPVEKGNIAPLLEKNEFGVVDVQGVFYLFKKGADPKRNAEVLPYFR